MKKWLVIHDLGAFAQNPRMIGLRAKTTLDGSLATDTEGKPIPASDRFLEVKPGDKIVYYCRGDSAIKGTYEVVRPRFGEEKQWPDSPFQYEIAPITELAEPYDFKLLLAFLDMFKHLPDMRKWGGTLQGTFNTLKPLSDDDYRVIAEAISKASVETERGTEQDEHVPTDYREHLLLQYKIAEYGLKHGYRVYVAVNDKNRIKKNLPEILDEIPQFHNDQILRGARRVDVLFFDKHRDVLTHGFEVEHTPVIYSGLLRLNDIAESYPSANTKFIIVSSEENRDKFHDEVDRPSFRQLRECGCAFYSYKEVDEAWKEVRGRKPPKF